MYTLKLYPTKEIVAKTNLIIGKPIVDYRRRKASRYRQMHLPEVSKETILIAIPNGR